MTGTVRDQTTLLTLRHLLVTRFNACLEPPHTSAPPHFSLVRARSPTLSCSLQCSPPASKSSSVQRTGSMNTCSFDVFRAFTIFLQLQRLFQPFCGHDGPALAHSAPDGSGQRGAGIPESGCLAQAHTRQSFLNINLFCRPDRGKPSVRPQGPGPQCTLVLSALRPGASQALVPLRHGKHLLTCSTQLPLTLRYTSTPLPLVTSSELEVSPRLCTAGLPFFFRLQVSPKDRRPTI